MITFRGPHKVLMRDPSCWINSLCCFGKMAGLPRKTALVSRQGSPSPSGSTRPSSRPRSDRKTAGPSGGRRTSRPRCKLTSPDCGSPRSPTATWKKTPVFPRRHGIGALLALPRPRSLPAVGADTRPTIHLAQLRVIPNQLQAFTRKTDQDWSNMSRQPSPVPSGTPAKS